MGIKLLFNYEFHKIKVGLKFSKELKHLRIKRWLSNFNLIMNFTKIKVIRKFPKEL